MKGKNRKYREKRGKTQRPEISQKHRNSEKNANIAKNAKNAKNANNANNEGITYAHCRNL